MAFQILLNLLIALVWMYLKSSYDLSTFVVGFLIGLILIFIARHFLNTRFYLGRVWAVIYLVLLFLKELILSNINVLKIVLSPTLNFQPGIFEYKTSLKKEWEVTVLSNLITLTPGTWVVDVLENGNERVLYIHAIHVPNVEEAVDGIKNTFEKAILEVSR